MYILRHSTAVENSYNKLNYLHVHVHISYCTSNLLSQKNDLYFPPYFLIVCVDGCLSCCESSCIFSLPLKLNLLWTRVPNLLGKLSIIINDNNNNNDNDNNRLTN